MIVFFGKHYTLYDTQNLSNYDIENTPTFTYNDDYAYGKPAYVETKPFEPYAYPFKTEDALDIAYKNSPDLQVLINTKYAMEQSLKYVKRTYLPDLTADVGYGLNHTNFTNNNSLTIGVNLTTNVNLMEFICYTRLILDICPVNEVNIYGEAS